MEEGKREDISDGKPERGRCGCLGKAHLKTSADIQEKAAVEKEGVQRWKKTSPEKMSMGKERALAERGGRNKKKSSSV